MSIKTFIIRNRVILASCVAAIVAAILTVLAAMAIVFFGYFHVEPQSLTQVTIVPTEIVGTKEDGSAISGFIIEKDDTQYLVTDYWNPIQLTDEEPAA